MNLLNDQREQDQGPVGGDALSDKGPAQGTGGPLGQKPEGIGSLGESPSLYEKRPKKRSGLPVFLLVVALIFIGAAVVYFGFWKKREPELTPEQVAEQAMMAQDSLLEAEAEAEGEGEAATETPAQAETRTAGSVAEGIGVIENITEALLGSVGDGIRLNSLILDDGSFFMEVSGPPSGLRTFQTNLKNQLPASVSLSPGPVTGTKTLISGTFPPVGMIASGTAVNQSGAMEDLSRLASSAGVRVMEKSASAARAGKALVHFKVSGSVSSCREFLREFFQKNWNMQVSKIILMPSGGQRATLVLRFLI